MSVSATIGMTLTVVETFTANVPFVSSTRNSITHSGLTESETLGAATSPTATVLAQGDFALTAGTGTLDLTALEGTQGTVSLSGLKPRAIIVRAKAANANPITIDVGASNGYTGFGAAFNITLQPGQKVMIEDNGAGTAVSGTVKTLDLTGTSAQGIDYMIVGGG